MVNAEMIMGLVIISIVAVIMVIIGISQFSKKENPVGFYNVIDPPKKEEIYDVIQWNKKHGFIWIVYGICIELGFWLGYIMPSEVLEMVFMMRMIRMAARRIAKTSEKRAPRKVSAKYRKGKPLAIP